MKQLLQRLDTGETIHAEVPVPVATARTLVVETRATLVSAGTERMLLEFSRASLIEKARQQPDRVRQVLDKVRTDGLAPTLEAVRAKLDLPIPLGYCHAGVVVECGPGVQGFAMGDRVVTNGPHAEYVRVSHTLAARIPDGVGFEEAAFTPLAAIGLEGVRLAAPTLGETVVVFGLGLVGLLTIPLLRANGCRVIGIDREPGRLALGERLGAVVLDGRDDGDMAARVLARTGGVGADAVLLTLASSSDDPVHHAAAMSRPRGRLVLVGTAGLRLRREDFYRKELSFAVSCSYGPGRYDPRYEERGEDYPLAYVRWTAQRNFEAVLELLGDGRLDPRPLITHRIPFAEAQRAYDVIAGTEPSLGVVLIYPDRAGAPPSAAARVVHRAAGAPVRPGAGGGGSGARRADRGVVGVIGAGNFALRTLLPLLARSGARLHTVSSSGGTAAAIAAERFGFERVATSVEAVLESEEIDTVFVLTRHHTHAELAVRALEAGKHVFVEKPLALSEEELSEVERAALSSGRLLMVGFNRRFAPLTLELRRSLAGRAGPLSLIVTVNAGAVPREHWTQDVEQGGGRIVGEACHFIDLARCVVGSPIEGLTGASARDRTGRPVDDVAHLALAFADGSVAAIHYLASGARSFPKERVECFVDGRTMVVENWRRLRRYGAGAPWIARSRRMDKGHAEEMARWMRAVRGEGEAVGPPEGVGSASGGRAVEAPIPLAELMEVSRWAIRAAALARGTVS
jgi:predicted dehydrogenase/threonine dehydrogenase-like Zn-dependent dehydrogenase